MPLSESERRSLDALEASLRENDPKFVKTMSAGGRFSTRNIVLGILVLFVGLAVLLVGSSADILLLGVFGFLIMGFAGWLMTKKVHAIKDSSTAKPQSDFMKKLEEQWDERKRQEGK